MTRPSTRTMFLGHPLVSVPLVLIGLAGLAVCFMGGPSGIFPGLMFFAMLGVVGKATTQAGAYRRWQREWDAMAGQATPPTNKLKGCTSWLLAALLAVGSCALIAVHPALFGALIVCAVPVLAIVGLVRMARRRRHRSRRAAPEMAVKVVAKATVPAPTLAAAYAALPDYGQQVMARSAHGK